MMLDSQPVRCNVNAVLLVLVLLLANTHSACAGEEHGILEDSLAGVTVGTPVDDLLSRYPDLRRSTIPSMGTVQYEGCQQDSSELFTFIEQPSSRGVISAIWIHHVEPPTVCGPGGVPELALSAVTPRGIRLGETKSEVVKRYGKPDRQRALTDGRELLEYRSKTDRRDPSANDVRLFFRLSRGTVVDVTLSGGLSPAPATSK